MKIQQYRSPLVLAFTVLPLLVGGCALSGSGADYRETSQEEPGGSLDLLTADEISNYPSATSVEELLEQHFSGLYIRADHRPGGAGDLYMLGTASPLFVIDGVPIDYTGSLGLNPRDVDSIRLVKHGGSAYYGLRGSGGAILITTKGR